MPIFTYSVSIHVLITLNMVYLFCYTQIYGYDLKDSMVEVPPRRTPGPFDYTRPFSNTAFFPQISSAGDNTLTTTKRRPGAGARSGDNEVVCMSASRFDINRGYTMGHIPVKDRLVHSSVPSGLQLQRSKSASSSAYHYKKPKADTLYLWHTLSGTLVHVKNHPSQAPAF